MGKKTKKEIILNATPLIYLGKTSLLEKIIETFDEIYTTESVYHEVVVKGKEVGAEEAYTIEKYIKKGKIKIIQNPPVTDIFSETYQLGKGESSTILAAKNKNYVAIIDDERARRIGFKHNIEVHGTLFLLKLLFLLKKINKTEIRNTIQKIIQEGFRLDTSIILTFLKDIEIEETER